MKKIVIPVGPDQPEDDLIDLVGILKKRFPDQILRTSEALVIETDVPQVEALFSALPTVIHETGNGKQPGAKKTYDCIVCGGPVSKPNKRCRSCGQKHLQPGDEAPA